MTKLRGSAKSMEGMIERWVVRLANDDVLVIAPEELDEDNELWEDCVILGTRWYTEEELSKIGDY